MTQRDNPRVGLSSIAHHVWDPDTSKKKGGGGSEFSNPLVCTSEKP
jgi:hypothetical protein